MSDSTPSSFEHLPLETLQGIFRYLDIPDILRLRRVSQYLNGVSQHRDVWSDAYRRSDYIRPPGPFLSQSAHDLERALIASYRVDQNLCYLQGFPFAYGVEKSVMTAREIRYTGIALNVSLVFGRFLFVALSEEVRCYDLDLDVFDSNSAASILYRSNYGRLRSFYCVSSIDAEGRPFACVVMSEGKIHNTQISIYSVHIDQSEVTLDLIHQVENEKFGIETVDLGPRILVIHGRSDYIGDWDLLLFDVQACTELSVHVSPVDEDEASLLHALETPLPTTFSTSTHLVLARSFYSRISGWNTWLEAFHIPPVQHRRQDHNTYSSKTPLTATHRGLIRGVNMADGILLQDAIIDPTTKDVLIKIRAYTFQTQRPRSPLSICAYICLCASRSTGTDAGNIISTLGSIEFRKLCSLDHLLPIPFLHPSLNGSGRVFYTREPGSYGIIAAFLYDVSEVGEAKIVNYPSLLRLPTPKTLLDYDPYSGRICLRYTMTKYSIIEILDFVV